MNNLDQIVTDLVNDQTKHAKANMSASANALSGALDEILESVKRELTAQIKKEFYQIDINELVRTAVTADLQERIKTLNFPNNSIPGNAVDLSGRSLNGNSINGGTITGFSSTGIEDKADEIQLTILNDCVAVEHTLVTKDLHVVGTTILDGDLIIKGEIPTDCKTFKNLVAHAEDSITESVHKKVDESIRKELWNKGIDLKKITIGGRVVLDEKGLGVWVHDSNLRSVGHLKELQVVGETQLSGSLYTSHRRVGINTVDPAAALAVWDEEVEIIFEKHKSITGYLGTTRKQALILGSNYNHNMTLLPTGEVQIDSLNISDTNITSAETIPNDPAEKGFIVFNSDPKPNDYVGWICLGGPRWAPFGRIE